MATKKKSTSKKKAATKNLPPSATDVPEPQTTVVEDPEAVGEVVPTDDPNRVAVQFADSTKSPPQPQTAYTRERTDKDD